MTTVEDYVTAVHERILHSCHVKSIT